VHAGAIEAQGEVDYDVCLETTFVVSLAEIVRCQAGAQLASQHDGKLHSNRSRLLQLEVTHLQPLCAPRRCEARQQRQAGAQRGALGLIRGEAVCARRPPVQHVLRLLILQLVPRPVAGLQD